MKSSFLKSFVLPTMSRSLFVLPIMSRNLSAVAVLLGCAIWAGADDKPSVKPNSKPAAEEEADAGGDKWMQIKLSATQHALASLTKGDFEALEKDAGRLLVMNLLEKWLKENDEASKSDYQGQLNAFEFSVKELHRHAQDKNMEGALQAFLKLNESCVRCHELIRD